MPSKYPDLLELAKRSQIASREMALIETEVKNNALLAGSQALMDSTQAILDENQKDIDMAQSNNTTEGLVDRLRLSQDRVAAMANGLKNVASLPDPVGEIIYKTTRPNGLEVQQIRVPLGVVAVIYESRPNVTSDSAGLCLKSSNAAFLRGSSAAIHSNIAIEEVLREAISSEGLPADAVLLVRDTNHETAVEFMKLRGYIDCLIPRGGQGLISSILENATVPYIIDGDGNCHIYVDASANLDMSLKIIYNAKTQRPSVCNAAESLVLHKDIAGELLPELVKALDGVEVVGDMRSREIAPEIQEAQEGDFSREFLDMKISVKVVDSVQEAIEHINTHNSGHSEAILTQDKAAEEAFLKGVDSGSLLVNASTRFIDGEEMGLGAEIGISTQKLHARGPLGLKQLTSTKLVVHGSGQIRT